MSEFLIKGTVQSRFTTTLKSYPNSLSFFIPCSNTSSKLALSAAKILGRWNGTSAPNCFAIFAISLSSVETITWLKIFDFLADSMV